MGSARDTPGVLMCVVGARPNYMKMAPLLRAFRAHPALPRPVLVHTGQHYDPMMNGRLFEDLELPRPDVNLEVGSATHRRREDANLVNFVDAAGVHHPHSHARLDGSVDHPDVDDHAAVGVVMGVEDQAP